MIPAVAPDTLLLPVLFFPPLLPPLFVSFLPSVLLFFLSPICPPLSLSLLFLSSSSLSLKGEAG